MPVRVLAPSGTFWFWVKINKAHQNVVADNDFFEVIKE
jgi:hypothetical protein